MQKNAKIKWQTIIKEMQPYFEDRAVVVIDSSSNYRASLKQFLSNLRINDIRCVSNTKEAMDLVQSISVGLIIAEWLLDKENGLQFCRRLYSQSEHRTIPFILMTAENLRQDIMLASEVGIDAYLLKPFSYEAFAEKVSKVVFDIINPKPINQLYRTGMIELSQNNNSEAKVLLLRALSYDQRSAKVHGGLAEWYRKNHDYENSIKHAKSAIEINGNFVSARSTLLKCYEEIGDIDQIMEEARHLHQTSPDNPRYVLVLASAYLKKGDLMKSEQAFKKAVQLAPSLVEAHKGLGLVAIEQKAYKKAEKHFRKALDLDDQDISTLNSLGLAYVQMEKFKEGIQKYKYALSLNPQDWRVQFNLGQAYEKMGRFEQSLMHYQIALKLNPNYEKALRGLQRVKDHQHNTKK